MRKANSLAGVIGLFFLSFIYDEIDWQKCAYKRLFYTPQIHKNRLLVKDD